jgi:xanthine dehydrogenase accessory protein XdhC
LTADTPPRVLVEVASVAGSAPREPGAWMLVDPAGQEGTIGGGRLEYEAAAAARAMLREGEEARRIDVPLGPALGQCCGGRVTLTLRRVSSEAAAGLVAQRDATNIGAALIFGAGHVGRALAAALAPLPLRATVIDQRTDQLAMATGPSRLTALPEAEVDAAPPGAAFVVTTHDHALDFLIAAQALARGDAAYVGMIGSAAKRARFERFARDRGVDPAALVCPIGAAGLGDKRPAVIAAHTASEIAAALARR